MVKFLSQYQGRRGRGGVGVWLSNRKWRLPAVLRKQGRAHARVSGQPWEFPFSEFATFFVATGAENMRWRNCKMSTRRGRGFCEETNSWSNQLGRGRQEFQWQLPSHSQQAALQPPSVTLKQLRLIYLVPCWLSVRPSPHIKRGHSLQAAPVL